MAEAAGVNDSGEPSLVRADGPAGGSGAGDRDRGAEAPPPDPAGVVGAKQDSSGTAG
ncbi:MAG: hypothetical protein RLZZ124_1231, partial [Cyanobacteriota bacterium]